MSKTIYRRRFCQICSKERNFLRTNILGIKLFESSCDCNVKRLGEFCYLCLKDKELVPTYKDGICKYCFDYLKDVLVIERALKHEVI